ncbi:MAG: hypothetical protein Q9168_002472 [Polycauliona sp. 1 TL-2023]
MAEWKLRGYVADSDDEDDTSTSGESQEQEGGKKDQPSAVDSYQADNDAQETDDHHVQPISQDKSEVCSSAITAFADTAKESENIGWNVLSCSQETDELHEGHHQTAPTSSSQATIRKDTPPQPSFQDCLSVAESESSPLTTPPSSPIKSSQLLSGQGPPEKPNLAVIISSRDNQEPNYQPALQQVVQSPEIPSETPVARTRNLRHRNPIQLHPYAIENEKYRQVLQNRGVRPLRIAQGESQPIQDLAEDSQAAAFTLGVESQDPPFAISRSSSFPGFESQPRFDPPPQDAVQNSYLGEDDLPDIDAILRREPAHIAFNGHKRRRLAPSDSKQGRVTRPQAHVPGLPNFDNSKDSVMTDADQSVFEIPLSPPKSQTRSPALSLIGSRGFRIPKGLSPTVLPTPVPSSEPRRQPAPIADASHPERSSSTGASSGDESVLSQEEPAREVRGTLTAAQRKFRGVLPASWLKLDLQAQSKLAKQKIRQNRSLSPEEDVVPQRGVARPVLPNYKTSRPFEAPIHILDSSSDAESDQERAQVGHTGSPPHSTGRNRQVAFPNAGDLQLQSDLWGEVAEDNRIDTMAPAASRRRRTARRSQGLNSKKRQTRLIDMHVQERQITSQESPSLSSSRPEKRSRPVQKSNRLQGPKFRPPDLSLLDVPSSGGSNDGPEPLFIRVAQRTVRSRNDQGKSAPDHKYLRMDTAIETQEANRYLLSWREGTLKPRIHAHRGQAATAANSRDPLQPCAGNSKASTSVDSRDRLTLGPNPLKNARSRNKILKPPKSQSLQISLDRMGALRQRRHTQGVSRSMQRKSDGKQSHRGLVRAGHLVSSFKDYDQARPAMLESLQANVQREHPSSSFRRHLNSTTQEIAPKATANPVLSKFLEDDDSLSGSTSQPQHRVDQCNNPAPENLGASIRRRGPCKRKPQRREIQKAQTSARDAIEVDEIDFSRQESHPETMVETTFPLYGLGSFGTTYTTTFDIAPLPQGSYFSTGTFLGSGDYARSFIARDLDRARGFSSVHFGPSSFRWGPWNDDVSSQLGTMIDRICEEFQQTLRQDQSISVSTTNDLIKLLMQIMQYFSTSLSFYDAIDRVSFLQRCNALVSRLIQELPQRDRQFNQITREGLPNFSEPRTLCMRALIFCVVLASQLRQISRHDVVSHSIKVDCRDLLEKTAVHALGYAFGENPAGFVQTRERLRQSASGPVVFDGRHVAVETLVVISHALAEDDSADALWTGLRSSVVLPSLEAPKDVRVLETCWERLLLILPFLEIDRHGILEPGRRRKLSGEAWTTVKQLLEPVLAAYNSHTRRQAPTLNDYCRATFGRCFRLIETWGWHKCESNIGLLFDFFARRSLFNLPNEDAHGSPQFLAHLDRGPSLELATEDRCFHIFLKIIGSGLCQMRKVYPDKKVGGVIWRLLPNHGRFLPKDQAISQVDLDALRNHHDLLCTLYWASPPGFRPKPAVIQDLVDVENSHKEACHINIRSWLNLVTYQLTANEPLSSLEPFVEWLTSLFAKTLRQHQNARTEAEEQVRSAEAVGGYVVNRSLLESTIMQNQRQVEAILIDLLSSIQIAMNVAPDVTTAKVLVIPNLGSIFSLFSIRSTQANKAIICGLEILLLFVVKALPQNQVIASSDNDDSQDYGDWSAFSSDVLPTSPAVPEVGGHLEMFIQDPLRQLLSNSFGADTPPEDVLLTKVIETWVAIGRVQILEGTKSWAEYIGDYGHDFWASLRDTEQTRKFLPYYLAVIVDTDGAVFKEHKQHVLKAWAASLMERELLLKYQHRLTSSLLNAGTGDSILANPPFWSVDGRFEITAAEFSERRLSLITNILSNMRKSIDDAEGSEALLLKTNYKEILKVMMTSMKSKFQELGQGSNVRGAYVDFVHCVIELLQQHTSSICPIDRFFTDSSSFPLPAHDPTYVVGQLKNYGLRLQDHRTPKQLAMFVQSVSERAAVDVQQVYLVHQLSTAMECNDGRDVLVATSLRSFLIRVIFPAYIDIALSTAHGWIMGVPILQAARNVFSSILSDINGASDASVASMLSMITDFLGCLQHSIEPLVNRPGYMKQAKTLKVVTAYFACITAVLPALDYTCRISERHSQVDALMDFFKSFALFAAQTLFGHTDIDTPTMDLFQDTRDASAQFRDVQAFAIQELQNTLERNWISHGEICYVNRGQTRREVVVDIGLFEEERTYALREFEIFFNVLGRMSVLGRSRKI